MQIMIKTAFDRAGEIGAELDWFMGDIVAGSEVEHMKNNVAFEE